MQFCKVVCSQLWVVTPCGLIGKLRKMVRYHLVRYNLESRSIGTSPLLHDRGILTIYFRVTSTGARSR